MTNDLLMYVESTLDEESKRIVDIIVSKYKNKEKVNKEFGSLVRDYIDKKLWFYRSDIEIRTIVNLPINLKPDPSGIYALIPTIENTFLDLKRYSDYMIENDLERSPQIASLKLSNIIIEKYKQNELSNYNLLEIISDNLDKVYSCKYDSIDARAITLHLKSSLEQEGYKITNINPLEIKAIN